MPASPTLGSLLRQRRAALDLTQEAAADLVGCATDTFRAFENGIRRPSHVMAERLAAALQIPPAERPSFLQVARTPPARRPQPAAPHQPADAPAPPPSPPTRLTAAALPVPLTTLVGRAAELAQIQAQLGEPACRLLSLVGPGGVGKTRLALQVAHQLQAAAAFPDGVVWVNLAPAAAEEDARAALAAALGLTLSHGADVASQLAAALAPRRLLLVLDNMEHLLALAALLNLLLEQAPGLRVLTTSRERLRSHAEWVLEISGLPVTAGPRAPLAPAAVLFLERARQVVPDFRLTPEHAPAVDAICRELYGVPLAIELAAAWTHMLTPAEIAAEIRRDLNFLASDGRLAPPHHRSLRSVFTRSWALLTPWEQAVCARLALFRGGCTREAVAAVVAGLPEAPQPVSGGLLSTLAALVQKSLVRRVVDPRGASRYELHELVRQFALEELGRTPAALAEARERHARYFLDQMEQWSAALQSGGGEEVWAKLTPEVDNLRLAWNWAVEQCDTAALSRSSATYFLLWNLRNWFWDAVAMLEQNAASLRRRRGQERGAELDHAYALIRNLQGFFHMRANNLVQARDALRESSAILGDQQHGTASGTLRVLAIVEAHLGDFVVGRQLAERDLELMRASGSAMQLGLSLIYLAAVAWMQGDYGTVRAICREAFERTPVPNEPRNYILGLYYLGASALAEGDLDEALRYGQLGFQVSSSADDRTGRVMVLTLLGRTAVLQGDCDEGHYLVQEALEIGRQDNDRWALGFWPALYAPFAAVHDDPARVGALLRETIPMLRADQVLPGLVATAAALGALLSRQGDPGGALGLLHAAARHPAALGETRLLAERLRAALCAALDPEVVAAAVATANAQPLDAQIDAALRKIGA